MNWTLLAGPIIGAIIGYFTNYIAVKLLFRPFEPKYIFGRKIPFTPGMIPKSQGRIANAIGSAVGEELLTQDALEANLLSPEVKEKIRDKVTGLVEREKQDPRPVREVLSYYLEEDRFDRTMDRAEEKAADYLTSRVMEMDLGNVVGTQVLAAVREKQQENFLAQLVPEELILSIVDTIADKVNDTVEAQGPEMIKQQIEKESINLQARSVGELFQLMDDTCENLTETVLGVYEVVIRKRLASILRTVDVSKVIRDKVNSMDPREMENLVLSVAKNELSAIVNLGALIGFVLGCFNLVVQLVG